MKRIFLLLNAILFFISLFFGGQVHFTTFQLNHSTVLSVRGPLKLLTFFFLSKHFNFTCSSHERNEPVGACKARVHTVSETLLTQKRLQFSIKLILRPRARRDAACRAARVWSVNANLFSYLLHMLQLLEDVLKMNKKRGPPSRYL